MKKVYVEITNACNLNCNFCIHNSRKQEFMTLDNFKIILKKCLTNASDCDILDELSLRRQRKITKNLDN